MRRLISISFGILSAAAGYLFIRKDDREWLRPIQIVVNELSWVSTLVGGISVAVAVIGKPRLWLSMMMGAVGTAIALKPYMDLRATVEDMNAAMWMGLGRDYEANIPRAARDRLLPSPLSVANSLGGHLRQTRVRVWRDVVFARPEGLPLNLDVYEPMTAPAIGERFPAIIVMHGGGWQNGDKQAYFEPNHRYLANQGYVVFDIQYRLSDVAKWPAQLEDVHRAIQWVREHADEYRVDGGRIALLGRSAGAHLALMGAMRADDKTNVQAVVAIYPVAELKFEGLKPNSAIIGLMGGVYEAMPERYKDASPVDWARDDLPPICFVEARQDTITPSLHGERLGRAMYQTNSRFVHLKVAWARHGFDAVPFGLGAQVVQYQVDRFLANVFYGAQY